MLRRRLILSLAALIWFGGILYGLDSLAAPPGGVSPGTLIKASDSSVIYYIGSDGDKYKFPDAGTYRSWFYDYRSVRTVPPETLAAIRPASAIVTVHPGSALVQFSDENKIYAVGTGALLRHFSSADVIKQLYGKNWEYRLVKLSPALREYYRPGPDIVKPGDFNRKGAIVAAQSIDNELKARRTISTAPAAANTAGAAAPASFEPKLQLLNTNLRGKLRPDFHPDRLLYRITADSDERILRITGTAVDAGATMSVNGLSVVSGMTAPFALTDGLNIIRISIKSSIGKERMYIVMISKNESDDNNLLAGISENLAANFEPSFRAGETDYFLRANYSEDNLKLRPATDSARASLIINSQPVLRGSDYILALSPGENTVEINVTAESGSVRTYFIHVERARFPAADSLDLSALGVSLKSGIFPAFNPKQTLYYATAGIDENAVTVTARPRHNGTAVMIDNTAGEQKRIKLYSGPNEIFIRVNIDAAHTNTYRLLIDKQY